MIRNAGLDLPLPIAPLAVTLRLFASFALLISSVGFTPLPAPDYRPALLAAIPLPSVTTDAYKEVCPALWVATDSPESPELRNRSFLQPRPLDGLTHRAGYGSVEGKQKYLENQEDLHSACGYLGGTADFEGERTKHPLVAA